MSVQASSHVWKRSAQKGSALLLMLYLADCAHEDGTGIYPSIARMSKATRLSERNIQYLLKALVASGELVETGLSEWRTRLFQIPLQIPLFAPVQTLHPATERQESPKEGASDGALDCTQSVIGEPSEEIKPSVPPSQNEASDSTVWADAPWLLKFLQEQQTFNGTRLPRLINHDFWNDLSEAVNGIDLAFVRTEFAKMAIWLRDNQARAPTERGVRRFVATWIQKAAEHRRRS